MREINKISNKTYPFIFFNERIVLFFFLFVFSYNFSQVYVSGEALYVSNDATLYSSEKVISSKTATTDNSSEVGKIYVVGDAQIVSSKEQLYAEMIKIPVKQKKNNAEIADNSRKSKSLNLKKKEAYSLAEKHESNSKSVQVLYDSESSVSQAYAKHSIQAVSVSNSYNHFAIVANLSYNLVQFNFTNNKQKLTYKTSFQTRAFNNSYSIRPPPLKIIFSA